MIITTPGEQPTYVGNKTITGTLTVTGTLTIGTTAILTADAANTLAQRNSTNSQVFNHYDTFTDTSNYRRASLAWSGGDFIIGMTALGTGSAGLGNLRILPANAKTLRLGGGGSDRWLVGTTGDLLSFGNQAIAHGTSALATNATAGFFMVNSCAGPPTGVPASIPTGQIPLVYDSMNNKIYAYNGAWKATAALS